jgi:SAM-dependent methyltransferase
VGLDVNGIRLILYAKRLGADFESVVTIGRQGLHLAPAQLYRELSRFGLDCPADLAGTNLAYCEPFFSLLGARATTSIDVSGYENATIIHDMNLPLPERLKGKFSAVVDAGTLEHIFNYPVGLKNCMDLLRTGGFFISITPANNFMGHGFYQFSPELFFSVFTSTNGFKLIRLLICEHFDDSQWYEVSKPKGSIEGRITLVNHHPTYLMCIACRLDERCEPLKAAPHQFDYVQTWSRPNPNKEQMSNSASGLRCMIKEMLKAVPGINTLVRNVRYYRKPVFPKRDYTPVDPLD